MQVGVVFRLAQDAGTWSKFEPVQSSEDLLENHGLIIHQELDQHKLDLILHGLPTATVEMTRVKYIAAFGMIVQDERHTTIILDAAEANLRTSPYLWCRREIICGKQEGIHALLRECATA